MQPFWSFLQCGSLNKNKFQIRTNQMYIPFVQWRTSGITNHDQVHMCICPHRLLFAKNLLRQVKLPTGSSKNLGRSWCWWEVPKHMATKGYKIHPQNIISVGRTFFSIKAKFRKLNCLPNSCSQLLLQDKYQHTCCIFKYSMLRPTSELKKIHSR